MLNPLPVLLSMMFFLGVLSNALPTPGSNVPVTTTTVTNPKPTNTTHAITTVTTKAITTSTNTQTLPYPDVTLCIFFPELPSPIAPTEPVPATKINKPTSITQPAPSSSPAPPEKEIFNGVGEVHGSTAEQKALEALRAKVAECERECLLTVDTDPDVCIRGANRMNYRMNSCRVRVSPCSQPNVKHEIIDMSECSKTEL
ncbi:hypothetical protein BG015_003297 [Linnemannia schmuckeri]|uniref:Uncharacterized protein n=1 Tax=Linnemannia schmuckeri TaxID=64567 RepID=A0A9P5RPM3_9FUNG|nr:hypothetical protein BG015_003297 [Linnemannia schmuckeri]